jgi:hypothetical protein
MLARSPTPELASLLAQPQDSASMLKTTTWQGQSTSRFHPLPTLTTHFTKIHLNVVPLYQFVHSWEHFPRTSQSKFSMHCFLVAHPSVLSSPS